MKRNLINKMSSNRTEDDLFWSNSQTKGFSFNEELDADDESNPWMKDLPNATKVKEELREDIVSLYSGISEASSEEIQSNPKLNDYPDFIWSNVDLPENDLIVSDGLLGFPTLRHSFSEKTEEHRGIGTTVKMVICSLLLGHEVNLEKFRSLVEKKSLLSKAIEFHDGNAILTVILFLQKTLRVSLFQQILMEYKEAADHYIRYLERRSETEKLVDILNMLGRTRDAMIVRYKLILRSEGNLNKIDTQLKHFYKAECKISDEYLAQVVESHFQLIDSHKSIKVKIPEFQTKEYPSVLKTLGFLSQHFYEDSVPPFSPLCFRATHNLNDKQYSWANLIALTKVQKWPQIESLLLVKSWLSLGGSKDKCLLPLEDVCSVLKEAPVDLISKFLRLIDDTDKKIAIAKRLKCHNVVLDVYAQQKDRVSILSYRNYLEKHSKEDIHADNLLKMVRTVQWDCVMLLCLNMYLTFTKSDTQAQRQRCEMEKLNLETETTSVT